MHGPGTLVLAHLFDATNASASPRDLTSLLSALLYQLAIKNSRCASIICELRRKAVEHGYSTQEDKERMLTMLLRAISMRVFIVIDALDEADDMNIAPFLQRLKMISTVSLLASQRIVLGSGTVAIFDTIVSVDGYDTSGDINILISSAISRGGVLERIKDSDRVRTVLLARADGK